MPKPITREELEARLDAGGVVVLEALPEANYAREHIPGALSLPHDQVDELAPRLLPDRGAAIVTYCANAACANSGIAARRLEELGYSDVSVYEAGKEDWFAAGLPLEASAAPSAR